MIYASYSTVLLRPNVNFGGAAPRNVGAHKCGTSTLLFSESTTGASPNRWTASLSVPNRVRAAAGVAVTFFITAGELTRLFGFCGELRRTRFTQTGEFASFERIGDLLTRGCAGLSTDFLGLVRAEAAIGDAGCSGIVASEKSEASENRARRWLCAEIADIADGAGETSGSEAMRIAGVEDDAKDAGRDGRTAAGVSATGAGWMICCSTSFAQVWMLAKAALISSRHSSTAANEVCTLSKPAVQRLFSCSSAVCHSSRCCRSRASTISMTCSSVNIGRSSNVATDRCNCSMAILSTLGPIDCGCCCCCDERLRRLLCDALKGIAGRAVDVLAVIVVEVTVVDCLFRSHR